MLLPLLLLLEDILENPVPFGKGNLGLLSIANNSQIRASGGELVSLGVLDGDQIVVPVEFIDGLDNPDPSDVVSLGAVGDIAGLHLVDSLDSPCLQVELDSVLDLDLLGEELEGPSVVGGKVADLIGSEEFLLNPAELEVLLCPPELDQLEPSLDVVEDSVGLSELGNVDHVHQAAGVLGVPPDLLVHDEQALLLVQDGVHLGRVEGDAELVPQDHLDGDGLLELVRALGRSDSVDAAQLVHHPRLGGYDSL